MLPRQELDQVGLVDAKIRHGAHGSLVLVEEPGVLAGIHRPGLGAAVTEGGTEGDDAADHALIDQLLGHRVGLGQTLVVADHQELPRFMGGLDHLLALLQRGGHGLFTQHMLTGLQGGDGDGRVGMVGHADADCVDGGIGQHGLSGLIGLAAVLSGQLGGALGIQIIEACQLRIGILRVFGDVTYLRDLAAADDTDSEHNCDLLL